MFGTISTALPPSGEEQFRKISQNWSGGYTYAGTYASFGSGEITKMGGREVPQSIKTGTICVFFAILPFTSLL